MDKLKAAMATSEFWAAIAAGLIATLVSQNVLDPSVAKPATEFIGGLLAVIFQRGVKKVIAGGIPFQPLNK